MRIIVAGSGYVGLVTGACFAESGVNVSCVDVDVDKVQQLVEGAIPIYEPGLEGLIRSNVEKKRLSFAADRKKINNRRQATGNRKSKTILTCSS